MAAAKEISRLSRSFALEAVEFMRPLEHESFRKVDHRWVFNVRCELAVVRCLM